jgi:hypothetical protein
MQIQICAYHGSEGLSGALIGKFVLENCQVTQVSDVVHGPLVHKYEGLYGYAPTG